MRNGTQGCKSRETEINRERKRAREKQ